MEIEKIINEQAKKPVTSNAPKSNLTIPVQVHYSIKLDIRKDFRPVTEDDIKRFKELERMNKKRGDNNECI